MIQLKLLKMKIIISEVKNIVTGLAVDRHCRRKNHELEDIVIETPKIKHKKKIININIL